MSQERTEQPTDKKLRDARREGRAPRSAQFTGTLVTVAALAAVVLAGESGVRHVVALMDKSIRLASQGPYDAASLGAFLFDAIVTAGTVVAPILLAAAASAAILSYLQVGPIFTVKTVVPDSNRMNPTEGFKRLFSADRVTDLGVNLARLGVMFAIAAATFGTGLGAVLQAPRGTLPSALVSLGEAAYTQTQFLLGALFCFGIIDLLLQRHRFTRRNMMTKQEVKEEHRSSEGDPQIRARRREAHRELLRSSGLARVRDADAVVVNPTHAAAAIRYREEERDAPVVVAAGRGELARSIRREAVRHGVPLVRNVVLAQSLADLEPDVDVPEALYETVAEILHFVYSLESERLR